MERNVSASGITSSGVAIITSIGLTSSMPAAVNTTESRNVKSITVCTASCTRSRSPAPQPWAITTPAPVAKPVNTPMSVLMMLVVEPTAASACLPTKFPTTMLSTVLYICWNRYPSRRGMENWINCFHTEPLVMSSSFRFFHGFPKKHPVLSPAFDRRRLFTTYSSIFRLKSQVKP